MYPFFRFGLGICMGSGTQFFPWIHVEDVCRIALFAIENNNVKGIVNGVAPEVIYTSYTFFLSLRQFVKFVYISGDYPSLFCKKFC